MVEKAVELSKMLYMAFDTPNRTSGFWLSFEDAKAGRKLAGTHDPSSAPTPLSLECTTFVHQDGIHPVPEMQHLTYFIGGMFALGGKNFGIDEHIDIGDPVARECGWVYQSFPTGIHARNICSREVASEGDQSLTHGFRHARSRPALIIRPEAIESIFIMHRMQDKEDLRETMWTMFESIMKSTQTPLANLAISNVTVSGETEKENSMESFWMAETLKYFYLILSSPLAKYHPSR
ncbi:61f28124-e1ae-4101-a847-b20fddb17513 [Sclerotinia trifoliorum]|uniref:alpha-1,2-Mannosidase n=1 Tax=Sclerotinia trifoliorum TaxID=28548 RepID=A0A8H2VMH6_9HELO|nr:61f28124-e1ae-4101-a847-b20fddb17513 [Sclerotinia trifoliorum]